jgi:hypothetical protein
LFFLLSFDFVISSHLLIPIDISEIVTRWLLLSHRHRLCKVFVVLELIVFFLEIDFLFGRSLDRCRLLDRRMNDWLRLRIGLNIEMGLDIEAGLNFEIGLNRELGWRVMLNRVDGKQINGRHNFNVGDFDS